MSKSNYSRLSNLGTETHFSSSVSGELVRSRMVSTPTHITSFNAGDIVPVGCFEVLPDDVFHEFSLKSVIRQTTTLTPTMGQMEAEFFAFFVPNRIVNDSWKALMGENYSGSWTATPVFNSPLVTSSSGSTQVPVGSVADYYGFPTQAPIPNSVLSSCHDLKFRGYVMIYNERFRDQNYQPPIPISYLNVYQGFFDPRSYHLRLTDSTPTSSSNIVGSSNAGDGHFGNGAFVHAVHGGVPELDNDGNSTVASVPLSDRFNALGPPLKANRLHDYFSSVLPSPQRGPNVLVPATGAASGLAEVIASTPHPVANVGLNWNLGSLSLTGNHNVFLKTAGQGAARTYVDPMEMAAPGANSPTATPDNLYADLSTTSIEGLSIDIKDIRYASAVQQIYEALGLGGGRYRSVLKNFFGLEVDDPFSDVPQYLGHFRRPLDLFQTAQTSGTGDAGTPQGNLAAFGYTNSSGHLFSQRFLEHGYIHILCVVRQKNVYPSFMSRDNFRLSMLDYYFPQLANLSNQPVYTREINPFAPNPNGGFGYQEAWAEYRYDPDYVTGYMRPGVSESLSLWNYADDFDSSLQIADASFIRSNAEAVLNRSLAVTSALSHQFKGEFHFYIDKERPMPTYSLPGNDII